MIKGLEILKQKEIYEPIWWLFGSGVIIGMIIIFKACGKKKYKLAEIIGILTIVFEIIFGFFVLVPTGEYKYTVKVGKEVSAIEMQEKYDIVSQDGDVWVIKVK